MDNIDRTKSWTAATDIEKLIGVGRHGQCVQSHGHVWKTAWWRSRSCGRNCCANDEFVRRFKNESKAISVLNHPNIVKVYDVNFTGASSSIS